MTPPTNMIVVGPRVRRPRPRAGDLLVGNLRGERWIAGRVVHMNCRMCADTDGQEPLYDFYRLEVREHTGPNPTDRGKQGCKRHVLSDAEGNPLVVQTTPANVPDQKQLPALLEARPAVQGRRGRPRRNPDAILGDRAYGTKAAIARGRSSRTAA